MNPIRDRGVFSKAPENRLSAAWSFSGTLVNSRTCSTTVLVGLLIGFFLCSESTGAPPRNTESESSKPQGNRAVRAGEFGLAKSIPIVSLPVQSKDAWLAQVAAKQLQTGDSLGAATTVRGITNPAQRQSAVGQRGELFQNNGPAGGGAFADFDSLIQLIETTVAPDAWDTVGGNSTIAEYRQGVYVDPKGTVQVSPEESDDKALSKNALANLGALLAARPTDLPTDWRSPSRLRCVSLRRLRDAIATRRLMGTPLGDELMHLAGLSHVQYVILTDDDVLLAAPVGGIDSSRGWFVDRRTGRSTLRSDYLARCLTASLSRTPFGCTIDPTPEGMKASMDVAAAIQSGQVPIGQSAERLRAALGMQRVEVYGAAGDTAVALMMVAADRHMKELALGKHEMPEGVGNYLDAVDRMIDQGTPNGLLLRLWFTTKQQDVRCDNDKRVFELSGSPIQLSGENQRALANGKRGNVTVDPRSQMFVDGFNRNWSRIRDKYPIYGTLESLYRLAAVSQLITEFGNESVHRPLAMGFATEDESRDWNIVAPKRVESIATLHTVRKGKKRHHILLASGGVAIETEETLSPRIETYPTLSDQQAVSSDRPNTVNRWWWDISAR